MKLRLEPSRAKPLRGKDGAAGRDGLAGLPGRDGGPGRDGVDGLPGRDGEPGRTGADGKSVTLEEVRPLIEQLVEKIPKPRNGENGRDGQNGRTGSPGLNGWSPQLAVVVDGERRVHQVIDWVGGEGPAPETGWYIGPKGPVKSAAEATDLRGAPGHVGVVQARGGSIGVQSIVPGANVTVDATDPKNPIVSASGGGFDINTVLTNASGQVLVNAAGNILQRG